MRSPWQRLLAMSVLGASLLAGTVHAVTVNGLQEDGFRQIYGIYARGGDCSRTPRVMIDANGMNFDTGSRKVQVNRLEYAASYFGIRYEGIMLAFFPFPRTSSDLGPVILTANDGEKQGALRIEANAEPGMRLDPFHAALTGTYLRCSGAAKPVSASGAAPTPKAAPAPVPVSGTPWEILPVQGRTPIAYVEAAGSPSITSLTLYCENARPYAAMLLGKPINRPQITLTWNFAGRLVHVPVRRADNRGTYWVGGISGTDLVGNLLARSGSVGLRIDGRAEGQASLANAAAAIRGTLRPCAAM